VPLSRYCKFLSRYHAHRRLHQLPAQLWMPPMQAAPRQMPLNRPSCLPPPPQHQPQQQQQPHQPQPPQHQQQQQEWVPLILAPHRLGLERHTVPLPLLRLLVLLVVRVQGDSTPTRINTTATSSSSSSRRCSSSSSSRSSSSSSSSSIVWGSTGRRVWAPLLTEEAVALWTLMPAVVLLQRGGSFIVCCVLCAVCCVLCAVCCS